MTWIAKKTRVAEHAREIADVSDRWFLSITGGLAGLGSWAEREAWIVADSAVTAFATTVTVAKRFSSTTQPRGPRSGRPSRTFTGAARLDTGDPDARAPYSRSALELGLDLICGVRPDDEPSAISPEVVHPRRLGVDGAALASPSPPGVIPLLQALERTVAKHTHAGSGSLQDDPRFWTLINLIQRLGRPAIACAVEEAEAPSDVQRDLASGRQQ